MENARPIAYLALLLVIPATVLAFSTLRPTRAALAVLFGSLLFLPELVSFDAPLVPAMDKHSIPALCVIIAVLITAGERLRKARPGRGMDLFMLAFVPSVVGTVLTNPDPLVYGSTVLEGLTPKDILSDGIYILLRWYIPYLLGRALFRSAEDARDLLRALTIGGILYLPFIIVELRFSPQWHNWIYGFGQHSFLQTMRSGGYRPMVFMAHGLSLSLFMWAALVSAWALSRAKVTLFGIPTSVVAWVFTLLFPLLKSLGALIYALIAVPFGRFVSPRGQLRLATLLALIVAVYPIWRTSDAFPRETLVNMAASINPERAESLDFRFMNEENLAAKALERPLFGWGHYGRSRIWAPWGQDISVTDGEWLLLLGPRGIFGFIVYFGALLIPIVLARKSLARLGRKEQELLACVTLLAAFYALDLLPNGAFNSLPLLLSGAVTGLSQGMLTERSRGLNPQLIARWLTVLRRSAGATAAKTLRAP